jgi:hypothetical protein
MTRPEGRDAMSTRIARDAMTRPEGRDAMSTRSVTP